MTAQSKSTIKSYFTTGSKPTAAQFIDFIDSYQDFNTPTNSYYVDSGTASSYVITTSPVTAAYTDGLAFYVKFINASSGGSTLNAGPGAVPLTYMDGTGLSSGTIPAMGIGLVAYSSTNSSFQLLNIIPSTAGGAITALTGDVTASGTGSVAATIANNAVTLAKMATQAANTVLANATAGAAIPTAVALTASTILGRGSSGDIVPVSVGSGLAMSAGGVLSVSGSSGILSVHSQVFTSNGTYTPTAGMAYCIIECVAGGAGGGGNTGGGGTGGGGAGGYSRTTATSATVGASLSVTIGSGGAGGTTTVGGSGGDTSVGAICVAKGGTGGTGGATTAPAVIAGGAGGIAGTGDFSVAGQAGGYGFISVSTLAVSGYGGNSVLGGGGQAVATATSSFVVGVAGVAYGSGGSGAAVTNGSNRAGGAGKAGITIITEFCTI